MSEWMIEATQKIKISLWTTFPLFLFTLLIPIAALNTDFLIPENESLGVWFQRCGALVVAMALLVETKNNLIAGYIYPTGFSSHEFVKLKKSFGFYFNFYKWCGFVLAITGTIIWGYGDLLFGRT